MKKKRSRMELDIERHASPSLSPPLKRHRPSTSDLTLSLALTPSLSPACDPPPPTTALKHEEHGVRLIQLLLSCAAAAESMDITRADGLLHLVCLLSCPPGDALQRLSSRLSSALARRLLRHRLPGLLSALQSSLPPYPSPAAHLAFARGLPYVPLAHAAAAHALLRAAAGERAVHALDLGASPTSADLWMLVLRSLSRLTGGAPPHVRLTCVSPDPHLLHFLASALTKEAELLDLPFQFCPVRSTLSRLNPADVCIRSGEALMAVSILGLHHLLADDIDETNDEKLHGSRGASADDFLAALRAMRPKVVVLAEQEADHNASRLVDRFVEALHHYGAVFDSIEAAVAAGAIGEDEREAVEGVIGAEMENVVGCEGEERVERHERAAQWARRMGKAGFRQGRVWCEDARRVADSWPGGYGVVVEKEFLMACWHDRPLFAVSAWHP